MLKIKNGDENEALQEYIRRIHNILSAKYILKELKNELTIPNYPTLSFAEDLALICQSHTEDFEWIKKNLKTYEVKGDYSYNPQYIACLLRLGDILDIDSNRTPYNLYKLINPKGISDCEWKQHYIITNHDKIIFNSVNSKAISNSITNEIVSNIIISKIISNTTITIKSISN